MRLLILILTLAYVSYGSAAQNGIFKEDKLAQPSGAHYLALREVIKVQNLPTMTGSHVPTVYIENKTPWTLILIHNYCSAGRFIQNPKPFLQSGTKAPFVMTGPLSGVKCSTMYRNAGGSTWISVHVDGSTASTRSSSRFLPVTQSFPPIGTESSSNIFIFTVNTLPASRSGPLISKLGASASDGKRFNGAGNNFIVKASKTG